MMRYFQIHDFVLVLVLLARVGCQRCQHQRHVFNLRKGTRGYPWLTLADLG